MPHIKHRCITLLSSLHNPKLLLPLHALFETSGVLSSDKFLSSELIRVFSISSLSSLHHAHLLLLRLPHPSTASWNHVIRGYANHGSSWRRESVEVFLQMRRCGRPSASPNELTFPFVLNSAAGLKDLYLGRQVQSNCVKSGVGDVIYVGNALIFLYSCCGELGFARKMFDEMPIRSLVSWNSVLSAYAVLGSVEELLKVFGEMVGGEFEPDEATFVVLVSAAAEAGNLGMGRWLHGRIVVSGTDVNVKLGTCLVDMYAKSGAVWAARWVFEGMHDRNVWTWSAMIMGLAQHGLAAEALELFDVMKKTVDLEPNDVTYLGVLVACSHGGLVNEARDVFNEMMRDGRICVRMEHYSAMVDVLGRNGRLEEAYAFVKGMPVKADAVVWRTLLSACNVHGVADSDGMGHLARQRLLELEPERTGNRVLVANMYAEAGLWGAAEQVRMGRSGEGMKKVPGESCIVLGAYVARFVCNGNISHVNELCRLLDALGLHIKTETSLLSL